MTIDTIDAYGFDVELFYDSTTKRWHIGYCGPSFPTRREAIMEAKKRVLAMIEARAEGRL